MLAFAVSRLFSSCPFVMTLACFVFTISLYESADFAFLRYFGDSLLENYSHLPFSLPAAIRTKPFTPISINISPIGIVRSCPEFWLALFYSRTRWCRSAKSPGVHSPVRNLYAPSSPSNFAIDEVLSKAAFRSLNRPMYWRIATYRSLHCTRQIDLEPSR